MYTAALMCKKRVRACDSCLNQALMDVGENEPKKEESKKCDTVSVFFYYEADEVSAVEKDHSEDEIINWSAQVTN